MIELFVTLFVVGFAVWFALLVFGLVSACLGALFSTEKGDD